MPKTAANARRFLRDLERACPIRIRTILSDNGKEFTDRLFGLRKRGPTGAQKFDRLCAALDIEHRLTPAKSPQTNGMVERFNGRIEEVLQSHHFRSGEELETTLLRTVWLYNQQFPQSALDCQTPLQAMKKWYTLKSELFKEQPYYLTGCDNQSSLHDDIVCFFNTPTNPEKIDFFEAFDKGHGRIETRQSSVSHDLDWLLMGHEHWPPMKTIIRIDSKREIGCKVERETRYFISSRLLTAEESLKASR